MLQHSDTAISSMKIDKARIIYITFDDGPGPGSEALNSLVLEEQIRATVFLSGSNIYFHNRWLLSYYSFYNNPYIQCGNGGFSFNERYYNQPEHVLYDFALNDYYLSFSDPVYRLPEQNSWRIGGRSYDASSVARSSADLLARYECKIIGWDVEWSIDRKGQFIESSEQIIDKINKMYAEGKTFTPGHLVLRCHERILRHAGNTMKLKTVIDKLKAKGIYSFEYLSNYPEYQLGLDTALYTVH